MNNVEMMDGELPTPAPSESTNVAPSDDDNSDNDLPSAAEESGGTTKWGPALPVTPRTAFMSVRGLA